VKKTTIRRRPRFPISSTGRPSSLVRGNVANFVGRVAHSLTLSPSGENVRSAKVESPSVSRRAGVTPARRQRMKSERRASTSVSIGPAADSIFVSVQHNFPFACVLPQLLASPPRFSQSPYLSPLLRLFACNRLFNEWAILSYLYASRPRAGKCRHVLHNIEIFWYSALSTWVPAILWYIKSRAPSRARAKPLGSLDFKEEKRETFRTRLVRVCALTRSPFAFIGNWIRFLCENKDEWRAQVARTMFALDTERSFRYDRLDMQHYLIPIVDTL